MIFEKDQSKSKTKSLEKEESKSIRKKKTKHKKKHQRDVGNEAAPQNSLRKSRQETTSMIIQDSSENRRENTFVKRSDFGKNLFEDPEV